MSYSNFKAAIFYTAGDLMLLKKHNALEASLEFFTQHIDISKVYLETYRCKYYLSKDDMLYIKNFFTSRGIKVSGAITTLQPSDDFTEYQSFCYSTPLQRKQLTEIVEYTAEIFDEIILDDFYFTNCKCDLCISTKGSKSWEEFRTSQMAEVSSEIIECAKKVNPSINMIIKYPNWYDHYQFTGYNPKEQIRLFNSYYVGTETRDSRYTQQALQRYNGYFVMRYLESINPGKNAGSWFDTFDCDLNTYVEQLNLTVFAKPKEITLFCAGLLVSDYKVCVPLAGFTFTELDKLAGLLGSPFGIPCYKPLDSEGEDYIHGYLGMIGLPLQPCAEYPYESNLLLLTESAKKDTEIVSKIKGSLTAGKSVVITTGLLRALNSQLSDVAAVRYTDKKAIVKKFGTAMEISSFKEYSYSENEILLPHIDFKTNDSWQAAVGIDNYSNHAVLLEHKYSKGKLYVLTIPDNFGQLYNYPEGVLNMIRKNISGDMPVHLEAPSQISLFLFDNDTIIIESFRETNTEVTIAVHKENAVLQTISTDTRIFYDAPEGVTLNKNTYFKVLLKPGTFKAFRIEY
jgi:hypothetical protein